MSKTANSRITQHNEKNGQNKKQKGERSKRHPYDLVFFVAIPLSFVLQAIRTPSPPDYHYIEACSAILYSKFLDLLNPLTAKCTSLSGFRIKNTEKKNVNNIFGALAKVKDVKALLMSEHESIVLNIVEMFNRAQGLMKTASKLFINSLIDWFNSNHASLEVVNIPTCEEFSYFCTNGILPEKDHFYLISEWFHSNDSRDKIGQDGQAIYSYITNGIDLANCPTERIPVFKQTNSSVLDACFSGRGTDVFSRISILGGTGEVWSCQDGEATAVAYKYSFLPMLAYVEFLKATNRLIGPPKEEAKKQKKQKRKQKCNRPLTEKKQKIDGDGEQTNEQDEVYTDGSYSNFDSHSDATPVDGILLDSSSKEEEDNHSGGDVPCSADMAQTQSPLGGGGFDWSFFEDPLSSSSYSSAPYKTQTQSPLGGGDSSSSSSSQKKASDSSNEDISLLPHTTDPWSKDGNHGTAPRGDFISIFNHQQNNGFGVPFPDNQYNDNTPSELFPQLTNTFY